MTAAGIALCLFIFDFLDHWSPLMCPSYDGESMTVTIGFHVCPEPGQPAEMPEQVSCVWVWGWC